MQIVKIQFAAALLAGAACSSSTLWMQQSVPPFAPVISERLAMSEVFILKEEEVDEAVRMLEQLPAMELEDKDIDRFSSITYLDASINKLYLVRAEKDGAEGVYSVFQRGSSVLVLYNHFGECGKAVRGAIVIRSSAPVEKVYGGCSSAL